MAKTGTRFMTRKRKRGIFIALMLAYPVLHFLFFWLYINFRSILMTFQVTEITELIPGDLETATEVTRFSLQNYKNIFRGFSVDGKMRQMIYNSLSYIVLNVLVVLPLSTVAAFVMFKRIPAHGFFRVMFFLPSVIPLAALVVAFKSMIISGDGLIPVVFGKLGLRDPGFLKTALNSQISIWIFCLWSGMGYNIILLSGAMARLSMEVLESGKLDGIKGIRELVQIFVPMIWPNITTMVLLGLMSTFTVALQPMMISGNINNTIGLYIYSNSKGNGNSLTQAATLGMICTVIAAPVILTIRHFMEKCFADVSY